ncbi:MAG: hypothetical protein A2Z16_08875 [Chloroflexi bacterium RBG_16_54_18]|nr:MAG: hypothetical protein A2Z16_08875 [Chloroflexi bacterium RBG_16_54_18]
MLPGKISKHVVSDRLAWISNMLSEIRRLPLESKAVFFHESKNIWAAESCLRRALEALFDLGRHILAKGYGDPTTEYKAIAAKMTGLAIISPQQKELFLKLAGYRNRLVHFYHEVDPDELYAICSSQLGDIESITESVRLWLLAHPESLDETL